MNVNKDDIYKCRRDISPIVYIDNGKERISYPRIKLKKLTLSLMQQDRISESLY